jgi:hypothetical protein
VVLLLLLVVLAMQSRSVGRSVANGQFSIPFRNPSLSVEIVLLAEAEECRRAALAR